MKRTLLFLSLLTFCLLQAYPQNDGDDIIIGKYRKLHSTITNEDRTLLIWLPRSYKESSLSYPVIYLLYGQNTSAYLMPTITACDMLAASGAVPEMIIVGVASAERYRDYSSISDGYIENTVRFFIDELFPFINSNYRTLNYRIVIGPQAGAVFSFYALLNHPDLFHAYIIENPFVGQNQQILFNMAGRFFNKNLTFNRFLYIKEEKDSNPVNISTASEFAEIMKIRTPKDFRFFFSLEEPSGYFVPPVPAKEGLLKLFDRFKFPDTLIVKNLNDIKCFYKNVSKRYRVDLTAPEHVLTIESDKLLSAGKHGELSELLEYLLSIYPKSLNALMRTGDIKRITGDYVSAIKYYDEFLEIMPVDAIAIRNRRNSIAKYINESLVYTLEKDIHSLGIDKAVRNFKRTKASKGNKLTYEENDLNTFGYALLTRKMNAESIRVFKLALELYPNSANLYDSLGEACMRSGDNKNAIMNYEKSLELNPANNNAKLMLEKLQNKK
jgi:predicted alpha/beta superfamily hydrolase